MTTTAQSLIRRCAEALEDLTSTRWPVAELVRHLNDGQREIAAQRPDAVAQRAVLDCTPGPLQQLPADALKLLDAVGNATATSRRALRLIDRNLLDAQTPGWRTQSGALELVHYMYDPRRPRELLVWPPAAPGAKLDVLYAAYPFDVPEPAAGATWENVVGDLAVPEVFANPLRNYILYRAFTKDAEYAGNAERAQMHYQLFTAALGAEAQATMAVAPARPGTA